MTLDNMTGITKGSYTGGDLFCKRQLITCNRVKECNGVCPFEDALKHADKEMNEQTVIDHDRDWIIGCIEHDGFIKTDRFDKANQIIHDALSADAVQGRMAYKSGELFLTLNNAVEVAVNQFDVDPFIARQELEQKCYIPCSDYEKGFYDGLAKGRDAIINVMEGGVDE